jgi:hypothetical protein
MRDGQARSIALAALRFDEAEQAALQQLQHLPPRNVLAVSELSAGLSLREMSLGAMQEVRDAVLA